MGKRVDMTYKPTAQSCDSKALRRRGTVCLRKQKAPLRRRSEPCRYGPKNQRCDGDDNHERPKIAQCLMHDIQGPQVLRYFPTNHDRKKEHGTLLLSMASRCEA